MSENHSDLPLSESLAGNEDCETVYLKDDEIDSFLETYLKENPDCEVETRYVQPNQTTYTQEIQVKWLRPETPTEEIPPIIIQELSQPAIETKPLKIIEVPNKNKIEEEKPAIVIREKPPVLNKIEKKIIYVPPNSLTDAFKSESIHKEHFSEHHFQSRQSISTIDESQQSTSHSQSYKDILKTIPFTEICKYVDEQRKSQQQISQSVNQESNKSDMFSFTTLHDGNAHNLDSLYEQLRIQSEKINQERQQPQHTSNQQTNINQREQSALHSDTLQQQIHEEYLKQQMQQQLSQSPSQQVQTSKHLYEEQIKNRSISNHQMTTTYGANSKSLGQYKREPMQQYDYSAYAYDNPLNNKVTSKDSAHGPLFESVYYSTYEPSTSTTHSTQYRSVSEPKMASILS